MVHDYPVCRCEDVALSDVRRCLSESPGIGVGEVKRRLRVGMGWCQGRVCGPLLAELAGTDEFLDRNRVLRPTSLARVAQCGSDGRGSASGEDG